MWYNHSTVLRTGNILFAVWVIYDPILFVPTDKYATLPGQLVSNLKEIIEKPLMIS